MSFIISVYSEEAFKEILLPAINNADSSVTLYKNVFGLREDLNLSMEVMEHQWRFQPNSNYRIIKDGKNYEQQTIRNNDVLTLIDTEGKHLSILVKETDNSFSVFKKYQLNNVNRISIGNQSDNTISYNFLGMVSKYHAALEREIGGWTLKDLNSANGVFVNYMRAETSHHLQFGDLISIMGLNIVFLGNVLAVDTAVDGVKVDERILLSIKLNRRAEHSIQGITAKKGIEQKKYFHRVPRNMEQLETDSIEIDPPPAPGKLQTRSTLMTIGPALTMALPMLLGCSMAILASRSTGSNSVFMYTGLVTAISSSIIGTVWAVLNMNKQKKEGEEQEEKRRIVYGRYLDQCAQVLSRKYEANTYALLNMYPSAYTCSLYDENSVFLWNRNMSHEDCMFHRLGIGEVSFQVDINIPKRRFTVEDDLLEKQPEDLKNSFSMLKDVPVGVDLKEHPLIGVIGGAGKTGAYQIAKCLLMQIGANNCYTDVKIAVLYNRANSIEAENLGFVKWLPHVWSEDKKTRYVADSRGAAGDILYELTHVLRKRAEEAQMTVGRKKAARPHYVLFVADLSLMEDELIMKYILNPKEEYGLTTIFLAEQYEDLPNACEYMIENDAQFQGIYSVNSDSSLKQYITFDNVDIDQMESFARRVSQIEVNEIETGGEIPAELSFLDMYHAKAIEDLQVENRWMKNRTYDSMRALIGQKAGTIPCYLDIHEKYHGPHGLVAGTTGSGKSETLQTYILSLAVNYSPEDIGFFIIDFKGGGMANLFSNLPHMMGQISNLSGNQIRRAMVSIKSENRRRQRLFNEHSVNNINQYTRLYKDNEAVISIPHLFIIIDEFAELKREEPDFMRELISVAQVGRSLGVHLILATQKPSGTVDDNIWSNSKFRLCLRVQDKQDSNDMLHKPDAAYLTQAGRGYLQVGNDELYEQFQSGYSGAVYDEENINQSDLARMLSITGKAALIGNRVKLKQKEKKKKEWLMLLLNVFQCAVEQMGSSLEEVNRNPMQIEKAYRLIFAELEKQGVDYPESESNERKLDEFLKLYIESLEQGYCELTDIAAYIMTQASYRGSKIPEIKEKSQLDAIVEYLQKLAREKGYNQKFMLWLPILPEKIYLEELSGFKTETFGGNSWPDFGREWNLQAYVGLYDNPINQVQIPLEIDLAKNGHHAICGTVVSGKSTFLQTFLFSLVCRYAPDKVNIYGIDCSSHMLAPFEGLAHVGGIMYENESEKMVKFFNMMLSILNERKEIFQGGNYAQFVQANGIQVPAIVIVIDQYSSFREKTNNAFEETLLQLARDGAGYGIFLVITAPGFGITGIPHRIADNIRTVICLEMSDKYQYGEAMRMTRFEVLPEAGVKGRGLAHVGDDVLEFQTAIAIEAEDDYERADKMKDLFRKMNLSWTKEVARPIPSIPKKPVLEEYLMKDEVKLAAEEARWLPIGYNQENAEIYSVDLSRTFCYLISGKSRTGKTNLLKVMMHTAAMKGGKLHVIDSSGALKSVAEKLEAEYISDDQELFNCLAAILPVFQERNRKKHQVLAEGYEDEEVYEIMSNEVPHFFFVDDMTFFVRMITRPKEEVKNMNGFMENITDKGSLHNVFFFIGFNQENAASMAGTRVYENMIRYKMGIHLGGNVNSQRILNFDYIPYMEQGKELKSGVGMLPSGEGITAATKIVIPYAGRKNGGKV